MARLKLSSADIKEFVYEKLICCYLFAVAFKAIESAKRMYTSIAAFFPILYYNMTQLWMNWNYSPDYLWKSGKTKKKGCDFSWKMLTLKLFLALDIRSRNSLLNEFTSKGNWTKIERICIVFGISKKFHVYSNFVLMYISLPDKLQCTSRKVKKAENLLLLNIYSPKSCSAHARG